MSEKRSQEKLTLDPGSFARLEDLLETGPPELKQLTLRISSAHRGCSNSTHAGVIPLGIRYVHDKPRSLCSRLISFVIDRSCTYPLERIILIVRLARPPTMPDILVVHLKLTSVHPVRSAEEDFEVRRLGAGFDALVISEGAQIESRED